MGMNVSRQSELSENEFLKKFVGKDHITAENEEFWTNLLQYHIGTPANSQEQLSLDSRLETLCQSFIAHNLSTGNFGSLIKIFIEKVSELLELSDQESNFHIWQTYNALFIIRTLVKYMIETSSEYQLLQHFEAIPVKVESNEASEESAGTSVKDVTAILVDGTQTPVKVSAVKKVVDGSKFEAFVEALVNIIVIIPVKEFTYHLHLEAVNSIIVLLSINLFSQHPTEKSTIFKTIYRNPNSNTLMSALLHFVSRMTPVPSSMFGMSSGGSFVFGIAESLWSIFTFRKQPDVLETDDLPTALRDHYPLANQSLNLILILANYWMSGESNLYRVSLFGCADAQESPKEAITFRIDFSSLYNTLSRIGTTDQATLILYLLLHNNKRFHKYVMDAENIQQLIIPILQTLYNAPNSTAYHIYMSLVVLLILSENDGFNSNIHSIMLKNITWYTEKTISEISLGGLLIVVILRTIQYNMLKMRDKYLHTNCLAALANMSSHFRSLHPYVAQRLVSLFEILAKKHSRLGTQIKETTATSHVAAPDTETSPEDVHVAIDVNVDSSDMLQDLGVLEEVLRMILEILNSCLSHQLVYCPNLVYTLLYKKNVFENFRNHPTFQDIIQNIDMVVGFFSSRLQRVQDQKGELGVAEVLEVISKGASQWSNDRLRKFPDLKFRYVEEDSPEEFFIPYVWSLVRNGCIHFCSENIKSTAMIN